ncbi:hypothetical protein SAMN04489760_1075 [Syntrophus gentianae]|uniref:Uncharacterized protein n=1 Tax=Syntrophus gentianae TaxID=43775 RepID=A0A1H7WM02_9BACT|nr:hypothetical protein SAMN04489760_1075 [Syntrophus gentianae]
MIILSRKLNLRQDTYNKFYAVTSRNFSGSNATLLQGDAPEPPEKTPPVQAMNNGASL